MATTRELTQLPVEVTGAVNPTRELTQLPVEVAYFLIIRRELSQMVIEVAGQPDTSLPGGYFETILQEETDPNLTSPMIAVGSDTALLSSKMGKHHTSIEHPGR